MPGDDAEDAVEAEPVDHRAAALERRNEHVEPADERPEDEKGQPQVAVAECGGDELGRGQSVVLAACGAGA